MRRTEDLARALGRGGERSLVGFYEMRRMVGRGSFGSVWEAHHVSKGTVFAIKEIDMKRLNGNMRHEISILRSVNHPNIVRLFEAIQRDDKIFLVLEYCGGGDLGTYLQRHGRVSADVARHFMKELAAGLQFLHANNIIHRDLKPQNLLLSGQGVMLSLKIGDFGLARYLTPHNLADTMCGSLLYMAPEIIQNQKYDAKADMWSVGVILYQLVVGRPPYSGINQVEKMNEHGPNFLRVELEPLGSYSTPTKELFPQDALQVLHPDCVDLCRRLLRRNPVERLTVQEFFNHKFLIPSNTGRSLCYCRMRPTLFIDNTRENYGRRGYRCPMYNYVENGVIKGCEYATWHDEQFSKRAKYVIKGLLDQNQAMGMEKFALEESLKAKQAENTKLSQEFAYTTSILMEKLRFREATAQKQGHKISFVCFMLTAVLFGVILAKYFPM